MLLGASCGGAPTADGDGVVAARRPNVVVIYVDDLAGRVTGFDGGPAHTPHLDALARESVLFERAYVPVGWCGPSRISFLAGRHPRSLGVLTNQDPLDVDFSSVAALLQDEGYSTGAVGKWIWQLDPDAMGFDWQAVRETESGPDKSNYDPCTPLDFLVGDDGQASQQYVTEFFTDRAIDFVRASAADPFFLWLTYNAPHRSGALTAERFWHWAPGFEDAYDPASVEARGSAEATSEYAVGEFGERHPHSHFARRSADDLSEELAMYYSVVSHLDRDIGRLLAALDDAGLRENTLVVFASDNGIFLGERELLLKGAFAYDEQMRVPLLVSYPPWTSAGGRHSGVVATIDLAPTVLDLCGVDQRQPMDGRTLVALLRDSEQPPVREGLLLQNSAGGAFEGVVTTTHKYVEWENGRRELYDLVRDPGERQNLAGLQDRGELERRLSGLLADLRAELDD